MTCCPTGQGAVAQLLKYLCISLIAAFCLLLTRPARYSVIPHAQAQNRVAGQIWASYPLLKHITSCESWGDPNKEPRQFLPDGSVLRGYPNPDDIGLGQINIPTWGKKAQELGFDLYSYDGNLAMSKWIFDHYGSKPWVYSQGCWGKYE
jgi:hypothetical protein